MIKGISYSDDIKNLIKNLRLLGFGIQVPKPWFLKVYTLSPRPQVFKDFGVDPKGFCVTLSDFGVTLSDFG